MSGPGHWELSGSWSWAGSQTERKDGSLVQQPVGSVESGLGYITRSAGSYHVAYNGDVAKAVVNGKLNLHLAWVGGAQSEQAPDSAGVHIDSRVNTSIDYPGGASDMGQSASNIAGSPAPLDDSGTYASRVSVGRFVMRIENPSHKSALDLGPFEWSGSAQAKAPPIKPGQYGGDPVSVSVGFSVANIEIDNRGARLSRSGAVGETYNASTNTTTGDTTYSYYLEGNPTSVANWQQFNSSVIGFNPSIPNHWSWTPSGGNQSNPQTWNNSVQYMPTGSPFLSPNGQWRGTQSGVGTYAVTYSATDADGATATAAYVLNLHDEFDNIKRNPDRHPNINLRQHAHAGWVTSDRDGQNLTVGCTATDTWAVGVTAAGNLSKWLAEMLGINLSVTRSAAVTTTVTVGQQNVTKGYATCLLVYDAVTVHSGTAKHWNTAGFVGEEPYEVTEPDNPCWGVQAAPLEWRGSGDPPPGGPIYNPPGATG